MTETTKYPERSCGNCRHVQGRAQKVVSPSGVVKYYKYCPHKPGQVSLHVLNCNGLLFNRTPRQAAKDREEALAKMKENLEDKEDDGGD